MEQHKALDFRGRLVPLALASLAVLVCILFVSPFLAYTVDDAFITFRYAHHMAAGFGPVFNIGERVEGYTSFSWMLLLTAAHLLQLDPVIVSKALGIASVLGAAGVILWSASMVSYHPRRTGFLAVLLLVLNAEVALNSVTGLETTFFMFLVTAAIAASLGEERRGGLPWSSLLFGLAALTRPEGIGFFGLHLLFQALVRRIKPAQLLTALGLFSLLVVPHWLWRIEYYGQLLPATYYAKLAPLVDRVKNGADYVLPVLLLTVAVVVVAVRLRLRSLYYLMWMTLGGIAMAWWEGGDWMVGHRFLMAIVPAWSLVAAATASSLVERGRRQTQFKLWNPRLQPALIVGIAAIFVISNVALGANLAHYASVRAEGYTRAHLALAQWLNDHYAASDRVALMDVGIVGYYSDLWVTDITGLTDIYIARSPTVGFDKVYDVGYVLNQQPAVIVLLTQREYLEPDYPIERRIYDDPRFQAAYELDHTLVHCDDEKVGKYVLLIFVRRDDATGYLRHFPVHDRRALASVRGAS